MKLSNQHKSLLITGLISGTVLLSIFNMHLKKQQERIAESYYELEPEEVLKEENKENLTTEEEAQNGPSTNRAFNETQSNKRFAQAYQPIEPPKDYEFKSRESSTSDEANQGSSIQDTPEIDDQTMTSFHSVNSLLRKQQQGALSEQSVNKNSSIRYSLKGRTHEYLPIPVYLCDDAGKVIINITVNASGLVTDAYVNSASTSSNDCLKESALEYAKETRFNSDGSKKSQIGSITFFFQPK